MMYVDSFSRDQSTDGDRRVFRASGYGSKQIPCGMRDLKRSLEETKSVLPNSGIFFESWVLIFPRVVWRLLQAPGYGWMDRQMYYVQFMKNPIKAYLLILRTGWK